MHEVSQPYVITTAIAYPNGVPHIGHAYEAIATDALARFARAEGRAVFFQTGLDEYGLKIRQTATQEGIAPDALVLRNGARFRAMAERFGISCDDYVTTREPRHHAAVTAMWQRMAAAGDIYLAGYQGWYSVRDEAFYAEDETRVTEGGVRLGPQGTPVTWTEEQTYFFRLSAYQERLLAHYEASPEFIAPPERRNEIAAFVHGGLQDLSISRTTFDWGVPVPDAPGHVVYVWVDALTNYLTGAGFPAPGWEARWPADLHVIGKDITRFHAVYWPAFLMSAGIALPARIFAHGFVLARGEKMSKSAGNAADPFALAERYGVDAVRYFLLREVQFGQDGSYSHEAIVTRANADLANDLGNLAQRSLSMIAKNCAGLVPQPGPFSPEEAALLAAADAMRARASEAMAAQAITRALDAVWGVVAEANRVFAAAAPWALRTSDPARMATVLWVAAEVVRQVAILARPFIPASADALLDQLGQPAGARDFAALATPLAPGTPLGTLAPVFPRLELGMAAE